MDILQSLILSNHDVCVAACRSNSRAEVEACLPAGRFRRQANHRGRVLMAPSPVGDVAAWLTAGGADLARDLRAQTLGVRRWTAERLRDHNNPGSANGGGGLAASAASKLIGDPGIARAQASFRLPVVPYRWVAGHCHHGLITGQLQPTDRVAELTSEDARLVVSFHRGRDRRRVVLRGASTGVDVDLAGHDRRWVIDLAQLDDTSENEWRLVVFEMSGAEHSVVAPIPRGEEPTVVVLGQSGSYAAVPHANLRWELARHSAESYLPVWVSDDQSTVLIGQADQTTTGRQAVKLRLRHPVASLQVPLPVGPDGRGRMVLGSLELYGNKIPLRVGSWRLEVLNGGTWRGVGTHEVGRTAVIDRDAGVRYEAMLGPTGVIVRSVELPRTDGPWGRTQQRRAQQIPARCATSPLKSAMVFECFWGRQASGNPLALAKSLESRLPNFERYWVINPGHTYAPTGYRPLVRWTEEWYEVMASAALVVTNAALAPYFRRRDDQVVVQTWHGTPLKRLGLDMLSFEHMGAGYQRDLVQQSAQWSHIVSPNAFCSEVFPSAFGYSGPLLEFGSPRNDVLVDDNDPNESARILADLGVAADVPVVLFAPTFRDGVRKNGAIHTDVGVDLDQLARNIGGNAVVLFRAHNYVASMDTRSSGVQVINVSDYPDIANLYRIADLLITDYSSVMFDFAVTGRPMVFHCPDLADYRDRLRGFYFDFEGTAPGPITVDAASLAECVVAGLNNGVPLSHRAAYDAFSKRYAGWEDGSAADQVADVIVAEVSVA